MPGLPKLTGGADFLLGAANLGFLRQHGRRNPRSSGLLDIVAAGARRLCTGVVAGATAVDVAVPPAAGTLGA